MPLIPSSTLLSTLSLFHLTLAYFLLTSPTTLTAHPFVNILGASMRLPSAAPSSILPGPLSSPNPATAFTALVLAILAISDFVAVALPTEAYFTHWSTQAAVRLCLMFGLCAWVYLLKPSDEAVSSVATGFAGELKNGMVFAFGFVEIVWMFWIFNALKEERKQITLKRGEGQQKTE